MKRVTYLISAAFLVALLAVVLLLALPTRAAQQTSPPPSAGTQPPPPTPPQDYLLALPIALPDPADIPAHLSPEAATEYARTLTERQAGPIQAELERLRAEGLIASFEVRPDLHGVVVTGATPQALEELSRLPQAAAVMPYVADHPPACALAAAQALPEQVLGLSRATASAPRLQAASLAPQATDPSINAYVPPGNTGNWWTYVWGRTTPTTTVTMRILRGGRVVATQSTTSYSDGWYSFYPSWQSCPTSGYNWSLRPGDVVEVTAHGNTVSTVIVDLRAWVDPVANTVAGRTAPGRSVEIWLEYPSSDLCSWNVVSKTVGTDGSGNFTANFGDFDRKAYATVYARDANGNSTYYNYFYAYQISGYFNSSTFQGYLKPEVDFTATLSRSGSIISTYRGRSDATNYYWGWFTDTIRAGDVISVSGGGVNIQYTATSLSATLDPVNNRATGTTSAGRQVRASFYKRTGSYSLSTTCGWGYGCAGTTAGATGAFTLTTSLDLVRGDYAYFYVYDPEGNYQYAGQCPVSAIIADLYWNEVSGYWGNPDAGYVTVTLKASDGTVKDTRSWVWVSSWSGGFSTWMGSIISPTDIIEVTDGAVTETMRVQNLTARLNGATGHLTGSAYNGHLVAQLWDFRREDGYWWYRCAETNVTNNFYDLAFSGAQVGGQDYVSGIWNTGPDGHYTTLGRIFHAFTVNVREGGDYFYGYSETPYTPVTVTLQRSGIPVAVYTTTSSSVGDYWGYLSGDTPVTITQGDILQVRTGDGVSVSLPIPLLTANADGVNNRIYGKSPANEPVRPEVRRRYNWGYYSYSWIVTADGSGNYSASFNGLYWSRDCSSVNVGHRCIQPVVRYYNAAGHQIWLEGPYPPPVGPDIYESDDISTTAHAYTGIQSHTFHTVTDTDWVTFTVSQADVDKGVSYQIETFNLGWGMATKVTLYDANMNWLDNWWGYENRGRGVSAQWTPSAAGVYYLEITPPSSYYGGYCDAVYDLMILPVRGQIYLPLVLRNYP
jgi:hypothetical protein